MTTKPDQPVEPIMAPATIGMLGGGQLGKYALIAALQMGYRTMVVDPDGSAPAGVVADDHVIAAYDDPDALARLADNCDVVTTEFENASAAAMTWLAERVRVAPSATALAVAQDRIVEKQFLTDHGFDVGPYAVLDRATSSSTARAAEVLDGDVVVKTARFGYDGKGQRRATGPTEVEAAWADLGGVACVAEARLELLCEVSVIVGRAQSGEVAAWDLAENVHVDGILDMSIVPARIDSSLAELAEDRAKAIASALDFVGVLAVEFFVVDDGGQPRLFVNELAPRPHNSGHWTLDACRTSQFEQQIRAVCGLGLGSTEMTASAAVMVNVLGDCWPAGGSPNWQAVVDDPAAKLHLYGKAEPRPARKMGHITVVDSDTDRAVSRALALRSGL